MISIVQIQFWYADIYAFKNMWAAVNGSGTLVWQLLTEGLNVGCGAEAAYTDIFGNSKLQVTVTL